MSDDTARRVSRATRRMERQGGRGQVQGQRNRPRINGIGGSTDHWAIISAGLDTFGPSYSAFIVPPLRELQVPFQNYYFDDGSGIFSQSPNGIYIDLNQVTNDGVTFQQSPWLEIQVTMTASCPTVGEAVLGVRWDPSLVSSLDTGQIAAQSFYVGPLLPPFSEFGTIPQGLHLRALLPFTTFTPPTSQTLLNINAVIENRINDTLNVESRIIGVGYRWDQRPTLSLRLRQ